MKQRKPIRYTKSCKDCCNLFYGTELNVACCKYYNSVLTVPISANPDYQCPKRGEKKWM